MTYVTVRSPSADEKRSELRSFRVASGKQNKKPIMVIQKVFLAKILSAVTPKMYSEARGNSDPMTLKIYKKAIHNAR